MYIHYRQSGHHEGTQAADVDRRIDGLENSGDQLLKLDITDHDLCIAGAADHSRIASVKRDRLDAFIHFLNIASRLIVRPAGQAVEPIGQAAVRLWISKVIKTLEACAGLDQRRNASC